MKKLVLFCLVLAMFFCAGCKEHPAAETPSVTTAPFGGNIGFDEDPQPGTYRPIYYNLARPYIDIVGEKAYDEWHDTRSDEEKENECVAVSFVKAFDVRKEDFERANKEHRTIWEDFGVDIKSLSNNKVLWMNANNFAPNDDGEGEHEQAEVR